MFVSYTYIVNLGHLGIVKRVETAIFYIMSIQNCQHHKNPTQILSTSDTKHSKTANYPVQDFCNRTSQEYLCEVWTHLDQYKLLKYLIFYTLSKLWTTKIADLVRILPKFEAQLWINTRIPITIDNISV